VVKGWRWSEVWLLAVLAYVGFLFEALESVGEEFGVAGGEVDGVVGC
jgi:hypothetical protein